MKKKGFDNMPNNDDYRSLLPIFNLSITQSGLSNYRPSYEPEPVIKKTKKEKRVRAINKAKRTARKINRKRGK